jgi:hypothetical protein
MVNQHAKPGTTADYMHVERIYARRPLFLKRRSGPDAEIDSSVDTGAADLMALVSLPGGLATKACALNATLFVTKGPPGIKRVNCHAAKFGVMG